MNSWKTTLFGAIGTSGALIPQFWPELAKLGAFLSALGLGGMGLAARDNDKSSEQVGIKTAEPVKISVLPFLLAAGIVISGVTAGCNLTPQKVAYNTAAAPAVTLDNLMTAWGDYVREFHPGTNAEAKVLNLYRKARQAELADIDAAHAYANTVGSTNGTIDTIVQAYRSPEGQAALAELADFLRNLGVFNFLKTPLPASVWNPQRIPLAPGVQPSVTLPTPH